jgi:hypothetical protein
LWTFEGNKGEGVEIKSWCCRCSDDGMINIKYVETIQ